MRKLQSMKYSHILTIWLSFIIMATFVPALAEPSSVDESTTLGYNKVTWDLRQPGQYNTFLKNLRAEVTSGTTCGFPTTSKAAENDFVLVALITATQTITLAFRKSNVYFVGYRDMYKGEYRANFVKEEYNDLKKSKLFTEAKKYREDLPFKSNYDDLERVGKTTRKSLKLGVPTILNYIKQVYGVEYKSKDKPKDIGRDMARFALIVIQMVAEGTRFKYIEDQVKEKGIKADFTPDSKFVDAENAWGSVSEAVHKSAAANPPCEDVKVNKFPWEVKKVSDIKPYVSLLKFKDASLELPQMIAQIIGGSFVESSLV